MPRDEPPIDEIRADMAELRDDLRTARAEVRVELGEAGREARAALREAMAEVRAAWAETWGRSAADAGGDEASRMSRARRKEMTRELLLDAAVEVFARKGYQGASLDDVAEAAGFTKGAVYSNFARKSELFRALVERQESRREEELRVAVDSMPLEFLPTYLAEWAEHHARDLRDWDILAVESWLMAVRDPALAGELGAARDSGVDALGTALERKLRAAGVETSLSGHELAVIILALSTGMLMDQSLHAGRPRSELFARAVRALLADVRTGEGTPTDAGARAGVAGPSADQSAESSG